MDSALPLPLQPIGDDAPAHSDDSVNLMQMHRGWVRRKQAVEQTATTHRAVPTGSPSSSAVSHCSTPRSVTQDDDTMDMSDRFGTHAAAATAAAGCVRNVDGLHCLPVAVSAPMFLVANNQASSLAGYCHPPLEAVLAAPNARLEIDADEWLVVRDLAALTEFLARGGVDPLHHAATFAGATSTNPLEDGSLRVAMNFASASKLPPYNGEPIFYVPYGDILSVRRLYTREEAERCTSATRLVFQGPTQMTSAHVAHGPAALWYHVEVALNGHHEAPTSGADIDIDSSGSSISLSELRGRHRNERRSTDPPPPGVDSATTQSPVKSSFSSKHEPLGAFAQERSCAIFVFSFPDFSNAELFARFLSDCAASNVLHNFGGLTH